MIRDERTLNRLIYDKEASVSRLKREIKQSNGFITYRGHLLNTTKNQLSMEEIELKKLKYELEQLRKKEKEEKDGKILRKN